MGNFILTERSDEINGKGIFTCINCGVEINSTYSSILKGHKCTCENIIVRGGKEYRGISELYNSLYSDLIGYTTFSKRYREEGDSYLNYLEKGDFSYSHFQNQENRLKYKGKIFGNWKILDYYTSESCKAICMKCGTIYENANSKNIYDGTSKSCKQCSFNRTRNKLLGEEFYASSGLKVKVVNYISYSKVHIEFEDGYKAETTVQALKEGGVLGRRILVNKTVLYGFEILSYGYRLKEPQDVYWECKCTKCGYHSILSPEEMRDHICKNN